MTSLILDLYEDWCWLDKRIETVTSTIQELSQREPKVSAADERAWDRAGNCRRDQHR
jgi:hypothetical protein